MLYEVAHVVKEKFSFLWNAIEWGNSLVFSIQHSKVLKQIPDVLAKCSDKYTVRIANVDDVDALKIFFDNQPSDSFKFFSPHGFGKKSLSKILRSKSFLTFVVENENKIVGYFFLRCFVNGKSFRGKIVDHAHQGRGIAKLMGKAMTDVAAKLSIRMFGTISPDNYASLASSKAVNEVKILSTLDNGYYYIEYMPKN